MQKLLGLDIGTKRIGAATGDDKGIVVTGQFALPRKPEKEAVEKIKKFCLDNNIKKIVVGLALHANGDLGEQAKDCKNFAKLLENDFEIVFEDERCSSFEAEENLKMRGVNIRNNKELIDIESACIILRQHINKR